MATTARKSGEMPDILPLMNGQDTSLLHIREDVTRIKSRYRDTTNDSVKSNISMLLYDPNIRGTLAGDEEMTMSHDMYDNTQSTEQVKATVIEATSPSKISLTDLPNKGSTGNLAHGVQQSEPITVNHMGHSGSGGTAVDTGSPHHSLPSSNRNSMLNGGSEYKTPSPGNSNRNSTTYSVVAMEVPQSSPAQSNRNSLVNGGGSEIQVSSEFITRNAPTNGVTQENRQSYISNGSSVKKSGSFQMRSSHNSLNRESYQSESSRGNSSSRDTSIAGSADIYVVSGDQENVQSDVTEPVYANTKQEVIRQTSDSSAVPSYMRDTSSSQAKQRASRVTERSSSTSGDKPPLQRSSSKTSSGSRPPSGAPVRRSSSRGDTAATPPASPTKTMSSSPLRSSSVKSSASARSPGSVPSSPVQGSAPVSRSSSVSRDSSRPRKPSLGSASPPAADASVRTSGISTSSSGTPSASKPPAHSSAASRESRPTSTSRQSSQQTASSASRPRSSKPGKFVIKHAPGVDGAQDDSNSETVAVTKTTVTETKTAPPPKLASSSTFQFSANVLSSQKAELKSNKQSNNSRAYINTSKSAFNNNAGIYSPKSPGMMKFNAGTTSPVNKTPSVTSPTADVTPSTPLSPMDEVRSTVRSGIVGKLVKDFKNTPLTGGLFDASSLERQRKAQAQSPTRKFKFEVEGIDVPATSVPPVASSTPSSRTAPVTLAPGTVPPPPPLSAELLASQSDSPASTLSPFTPMTPITPDTPASPPPPPPPPPDFTDGTPPHTLEKKQRGFTYIPDSTIVPQMKKKAEDVMARKPHEAVEEKVQNKRSSELIEDKEVLTLREARAKLHKQTDRVERPSPPAPPDYSLATSDSDAVIRMSTHTDSASNTLTRDYTHTDSASNTLTRDSTLTRDTNSLPRGTSTPLRDSGMLAGDTSRLSTDTLTRDAEGWNGQPEAQPTPGPSVDTQTRNTATSTTYVSNVNGNFQRSPDSAYHSELQSPVVELSKPAAPPHDNVQPREVTVQQASTASRGQDSQAYYEANRSFQTETRVGSSPGLGRTGQSSRDGGVFTNQHPTNSHSVLSFNTHDGLLTTKILGDNGPVKSSVDDKTHATVNTSHLLSFTVNDPGQDSTAQYSVNSPYTSPDSRRITTEHLHGDVTQAPTYSAGGPQQGDYHTSLPNGTEGSSQGGPRYYSIVTSGPPTSSRPAPQIASVSPSGPRYTSYQGPASPPGRNYISNSLGQGPHSPAGYRHHTGPVSPSSSRVVPLQPVSVDINLADRYTARGPNVRHLQTIHGMSEMAGEVMQPFTQVSSGGGRHFDYSDGRYVAEQFNFSSYERSTNNRGFPDQPQSLDPGKYEMDKSSGLNFNIHVPPKRKYLKVDESRSNGRVPMYNGDLESYEYQQYGNRSPRHKPRPDEYIYDGDSIHSEPVSRHLKHATGRRLQRQHVFSRSQPHLNEIGRTTSLGEPLYVSVPHSPPRYGTLRSARSETMLAQSPSDVDTLLLPHLEDARSKKSSRYPYHITVKLNQLQTSRPGSSHLSLQRSTRDYNSSRGDYNGNRGDFNGYNSLQSERYNTYASQSLSGVQQNGRRPGPGSSVSLVNIEGDPNQQLVPIQQQQQQPARYRENADFSRQEKYSYQRQEAQMFNGTYPGSNHVDGREVHMINANESRPQNSGEKEFYLKIDNLPDPTATQVNQNNNYIWKNANQTSSSSEYVKQQNTQNKSHSGKNPDFTMAINQTMTMDYLPKKKKQREEPGRRQKSEEIYTERRYRDDEREEPVRRQKSEEIYTERRYRDDDFPKVRRKKYLIENAIDTTSAPQHFDVVDTDDPDDGSITMGENNPFIKSYVQRKNNPGYESDEDEVHLIERTETYKPEFTNVFQKKTIDEEIVNIPVNYGYESTTVKQGKQHRVKKKPERKPSRRSYDQTDYTENITKTNTSHVRSAPRHETTTHRVEISEFDLERLLKGAPAGSVKQTINVEREEEEILGPLPITHADGEESGVDGLLNFDTVSEKVELGIVEGCAQLTVKVRCERVVPIYGVDDMFKKSSVIVTRLIEIDMQATAERRHLLESIMAGTSKKTLNESQSHVRNSSNRLGTKDTFQLYKTFMAMAEAEEGANTRGRMHVEKRLEDERRLPDDAEFDFQTEDIDENIFGEPVEMEFDTDVLERKLESQMMSNGYSSGTRIESMSNGRGLIRGQHPDTISYRSAASETSDLIY